jgi:hypothetical protein
MVTPLFFCLYLLRDAIEQKGVSNHDRKKHKRELDRKNFQKTPAYLQGSSTYLRG